MLKMTNSNLCFFMIFSEIICEFKWKYGLELGVVHILKTIGIASFQN